MFNSQKNDIIKIAVIGAGISGLSSAYNIKKMLKEQSIPASITIFEANSLPGGKIHSEKQNEFIMEWGPNGFLDNKPSTPALCSSLKLENHLLLSSNLARKRFVLSNNQLHELPSNPIQFFQSNLLSLKGRLRIIKELIIPKMNSVTDESLANFATRRLGKEAYEKLIDPMVSGVFAGNPELLSTQSAFPRIYELEQTYGGLIRALISLRIKKKRNTAGGPKAGPAGPGGILTSFKNGLQEITNQLAMQLNEELIFNAKVKEIDLSDINNKLYQLSYEKNGSLYKKDFSSIVLAIPAYSIGEITKNIATSSSKLLSNIPYAPVAVVGIGFHLKHITNVKKGFGFVVPSTENKQLLGTLFSSTLFDNRAPKNHALFRIMMGGIRRPELVELSEKQLQDIALKELKLLLGIIGEPVLKKTIIHKKAIPQYIVGHKKNIEEILAGFKKLPGLFLAGNSLFGISMNDCTREAETIAKKVISHVKSINSN